MSAPNTLSPYNEEILNLMRDINKTLSHQGHVDEHKIVWVPNLAIDSSVFEGPERIDERLVSLVKKLPAGPSVCIAPHMQPVAYLRPEALIRRRDIDRRMEADTSGQADQNNALLTVFSLLKGWESTVPALVLDVADSESLRCRVRLNRNSECLIFHGRYDPLFRRSLQRPALPRPVEHAPTNLKRMLEDYRTATWVSNLYGGIVKTKQQSPVGVLRFFERPQPAHSPQPGVSEPRRIVVEKSRWPRDTFRRDDGERYDPAVINQLFDEHPGNEIA